MYAKDIHRNGFYHMLSDMEELAAKKIKNKDMGTAFLSNAYLGYDCIAVIPNRPEYVKYEGYVLYDLEQNKAVFISEKEE